MHVGGSINVGSPRSYGKGSIGGNEDSVADHLNPLGTVPADQETKVQKKHYELQDGDEFIDYVWVGDPPVRKKKIKRLRAEKKKLTMEEKQEIEDAFRVFDKDMSGAIDVNELKDAMRALGIYMNKDEINKLMEKADKDGSGSIERDEFMSLMAEVINRRQPYDELLKAFRMYDDDDGGTISYENLRKVADDIGITYDEEGTPYPVSDEYINKMIKFADRKNAGEVDREDFMLMMQEAGLLGN